MIAADDAKTLETKRHFWMNDREALLGIVILLIIVGSLNVFSSSFIIADTNYGSPYFFIKKHGINLLIGLFVFAFAVRVDYHKWRDWMLFITGAVILGLILVLIFGEYINGAQRWLSLKFMTVQPAEFAKIVTIFVEASYIASRVSKGRPAVIFHKQIIIYGVMAFLIEREPDGATMAIVAGIPMVMLLISNMPKKQKIGLIVVGILSVIGICILQPYRMERIITMLDPWSDPMDTGYHVVQSLSAIGSGGLFGMGIGVGISKYNYLPEGHTDFAFAIWSQEIGFVGVIIVLALFAAFAYYGVKIANSAKDPLGQMLGFGLTALIIIQAVANMFMVAGWMPVIGVPLPFISYGGSSLLTNLWAIGIIMNIGMQAAPPKMLVTSAPPKDVFGRPTLKRVK